MALVPIRIDRTSKPPMGTPLRSDGHWNVQGLAGCWAFNEGAGNSAFSSAVSLTLAGAGTPQWVANGVQFNGTSQYYSSSSQLLSITGKISLFARITLLSLPTNGNIVTIMGKGYITSKESYYIRISNISGVYRAECGAYNGVDSRASLIINPVVGKTYNFFGQYNGSAFEVFFGEVGQTLNVAVGGSFGPVLASAPFAVGAESIGGVWGRFANCIIQNASVGTAVKASDQIASLSANPWQVFEPEIVWVEVGAIPVGITVTHDVAVRLSTVFAVAHDARGTLSTSVLGTHDTRSALFSTIATLHDKLAAISTQRAAAYDALSRVSIATGTHHDCRAVMATALTGLYDTLADISVLVGYSVRHDTLLATASSKTTTHDLQSAIATTIDQVTDTLAAVATSLIIEHDSNALIATHIEQLQDTLAEIRGLVDYVTTHDTRLTVATNCGAIHDLQLRLILRVLALLKYGVIFPPIVRGTKFPQITRGSIFPPIVRGVKF